MERVAPIPREVPLLVADALVALRAALEHALFAEVEFLDGAPLDEQAARLVEMPASDTYEKFDEWKRKKLRNRPPSLRAGSELVRRIDGLQPFHRRSDPQSAPRRSISRSPTTHPPRRAWQVIIGWLTADTDTDFPAPRYRRRTPGRERVSDH